MQTDSLRFYRTARNLKQKTVADLLAMSQPNYSNLENGKTKITFDAAKKLAVYYGVSMDVFISGNGASSLPPGMEDRTLQKWDTMDTEEDLLKPVLQRMDILLNLLADEKEVLALERKQLSAVVDKLTQTFGLQL